MSSPAVAPSTLLDSLVPLPGRLIVEEPFALRARKRTTGGIYLPDQSERSRRAAGMLTRVLRTARDVSENFAPEGVEPGAWVFIPEFAGVPLYSPDGPTGYWVIAAGDIIAVLDEAAALALTAPDDAA